MKAGFRALISYLVILSLSLNFFLFSVQRYTPPRAESLSYSVMNCPSHEAGHKPLIELFLHGGRESGSEKHCFCYDCCGQRILSATLIRAETSASKNRPSYTESYENKLYSETPYRYLSIRAPPVLPA